MQEKQLDKESMKGTIYVLLSAVCFSTGGVLIKSIPWSSITIQGIRSIFSFMLIASYMVITKRKFVWNKTVLFGAVCNTVMALTFVSATKMTTAANANPAGPSKDRASVYRTDLCDSADVGII